MNVRKYIALAAGLFSAFCAHAGLIGQTVTASGFNLSPTTATIGAGPEFRGIGYFDTYLTFDFSDSHLTIGVVLQPGVLGIGWSRFDPYVFSGFSDQIVDMVVESNQGFAGTLLTNFSFVANQISIDFSEGNACCGPDSALVYRLVTRTNAVPEPATGLLLVAALLPLLGSRKRAAQAKVA